MSVEIWLVYVTTILIMMSTPGPSQLLMLTNCARNGFSRGAFTAAGDLSANALQMLAAGLGLAAVIAASAYALTIIKWLGVAYLLYLGIRMIRNAKAGDLEIGKRQLTPRWTLWRMGFFTSAANPKAVVFFAALFPQFLSGDAAFWPQFIILSVTYLVIDGLFLCTYGLGAGWVASRLKGRARRWIDRLGGGFLIMAAVLLGLKTITED